MVSIRGIQLLAILLVTPPVRPHPCKWSWKALVKPPFKWGVLGCAPKAQCKVQLRKWRKCWPREPDGHAQMTNRAAGASTRMMQTNASEQGHSVEQVRAFAGTEQARREAARLEELKLQAEERAAAETEVRMAARLEAVAADEASVQTKAAEEQRLAAEETARRADEAPQDDDNEVLCDCAWTRHQGQNCRQTEGQPDFPCWADCCGSAPKADAEKGVAVRRQVTAAAAVVALLAGVLVLVRVKAAEGRRAAREPATGVEAKVAKEASLSTEAKAKTKTKGKAKARAKAAKREEAVKAAERTTAEAEADAEAKTKAEAEAAKEAAAKEAAARKAAGQKVKAEQETARKVAAERAETETQANEAARKPQAQGAKASMVASQTTPPSGPTARKEPHLPDSPRSVWGLARTKGRGNLAAGKPAAPSRAAAVGAPPSSPHAKYEAAVREALRQPNDVGRLRFEQFLRHLPSPNPSTFAWMRATLLRLAGGEATGGSIAEVVADVLPPLLERLQSTFLQSRPTQQDALFFPSAESHRRLLKLLSAAHASLDVCVFTITDDAIAAALVDRHKHGVRVRVISDDAQAWCKGADVFELSERGIECLVDDEIAVWRGGREVSVERHMHHKYCVVDNQLLITGSFNWTSAASSRNCAWQRLEPMPIRMLTDCARPRVEQARTSLSLMMSEPCERTQRNSNACQLV